MDGFDDSYQNGPRNDAAIQRKSQNIGSNIQKILQNVSSMQRMVNQIGTPDDNQNLQKQLHKIQLDTHQLAKETSQQLQDLNAGIAALPRAGGAEQRPWRMQKERLADDFTKALTNFQAAQRSAAAKEKEALREAKSQQKSGGNNLIDIDEQADQQQEAAVAEQRKRQLLAQEEADLAELQERERSIAQLESDIVDVNTIFKDLASLVHDQGEIVDSIEANVESTHIRVEEGTAQLRQAETYKNKARKKKVCLALIAVVVLAIIIAIIASQSN